MKVLIIGAGIGGLSSAIALKRKGHEVVIYERVRDLRPYEITLSPRLTLITCLRVGAAISVWSNGIKVLNAFGLGEEVSKVGGVMESMNYRKFDTGEVLTEFSLDPLYKEVGSYFLMLAG
jgi:FAD-dependent urate hydroxylase